MNELNAPRWNLDTLFSSIDSDEYKEALEGWKTGIEKLENLVKTASRFNFGFWLKGYLEEQDRVMTLAQTLRGYAYIIYSVDTTNTAYLNNIALIDDLSLKFESVNIGFKAVLSKNAKKLDEFFERFPQFLDRRYILEEEIAETKHQMPAKEEALAGALQKTGGDAWDRLHEQIISNLKDPESGKTFNEIRNDAYSADGLTRRKAWEKEKALLQQNEIAMAACLNNLKGETVTLNGRRKWKKAIDRALASSRMDKKTLNALIKAIEKSLPSWRKYFQAKAKYLRKNNLTVCDARDENDKLEKGLAFYDLFAPMALQSEEGEKKSSLLEKKWTFDEARAYVIARYDSFSIEMGDFARKAFSEGWIDAEVRPGKVGGAYDEDFAMGHQSRIMTNFTGTFSDIITLAHEIGHAYHFYCLRGKSVCFYSYPMTLAETASTFAETIVKQDMLKKCSEDDKLQLLDMDLQDAAQVLVDILCRFYFERSVFEEREKGELNAQDFCRLMKEAQEKSYGKGLNSERHEYMWAVKSHYYSTGLDFYNFPYAFGQLFAAALYQRYLSEGSEFSKIYSSLLASTGSMSCEDLCSLAGFDITDVEFWKSGVELYTKKIDEFIELTKGKSTAVTIKPGSFPETVYDKASEKAPEEKKTKKAKNASKKVENKPEAKGGLLKKAEEMAKEAEGKPLPVSEPVVIEHADAVDFDEDFQ